MTIAICQLKPVPVKRSTIRVIPEVTSFHDEADQQQQPSGKPDKISVTILKEYKVQGEDGNTKYVSIQDNDDEGKFINTSGHS
jgi:hypothetical protein